MRMGGLCEAIGDMLGARVSGAFRFVGEGVLWECVCDDRRYRSLLLFMGVCGGGWTCVVRLLVRFCGWKAQLFLLVLGGYVCFSCSVWRVWSGPGWCLRRESPEWSIPNL